MPVKSKVGQARKRIIFGVVTLSTLLLTPTYYTSRFARGQEAVGISVSPPTFELTANPGETIENTIKVINVSKDQINLSVDKRNFTAIGEEGAVGLTEDNSTYSLASWISVDPPEAIVDPGTSKIFTFRISIPPNGEPGGHFGSVVFKSAGGSTSGSGVSLSQEVASLILLKIAGELDERAFLESFNTSKAFYEYGPVDFQYRVKNEGNVHVKPTGTISIINIFGKQVNTLAVEPKNVLPSAVRKNDVRWNKKLLIGKYTATAVLNYGNAGKVLTETITFYAFPYKIGGITLAVLAAVLAILFKARRRIRMAMRVLLGK